MRAGAPARSLRSRAAMRGDVLTSEGGRVPLPPRAPPFRHAERSPANAGGKAPRTPEPLQGSSPAPAFGGLGGGLKPSHKTPKHLGSSAPLPLQSVVRRLKPAHTLFISMRGEVLTKPSADGAGLPAAAVQGEPLHFVVRVKPERTLDAKSPLKAPRSLRSLGLPCGVTVNHDHAALFRSRFARFVAALRSRA